MNSEPRPANSGAVNLDESTGEHAPLEIFTADLHNRVRHLESTLTALGQGLLGLSKYALEAVEDGELTIPPGLHLLGPLQHYPAWNDDEPTTRGIRCSCGWSNDGTFAAEESERDGMMHVAKWIDQLTGTPDERPNGNIPDERGGLPD